MFHHGWFLAVLLALIWSTVGLYGALNDKKPSHCLISLVGMLTALMALSTMKQF